MWLNGKCTHTCLLEFSVCETVSNDPCLCSIVATVSLTATCVLRLCRALFIVVDVEFLLVTVPLTATYVLRPRRDLFTVVDVDSSVKILLEGPKWCGSLLEILSCFEIPYRILFPHKQHVAVIVLYSYHQHVESSVPAQTTWVIRSLALAQITHTQLCTHTCKSVKVFVNYTLFPKVKIIYLCNQCTFVQEQLSHNAYGVSECDNISSRDPHQ